MGEKSNSPKLLSHIPNYLFGIDLPHPYLYKCIGEINLCLHNAVSITVVGNFLSSTDEKSQLEEGTNTHVLVLGFNTYWVLVIYVLFNTF